MKKKQTIDYWLDQKKMQCIGDFDGLYSSIDDPWGCKEDVLSLNNNILLDLVSEVSSNKLCYVHDLGCGLGHFVRSRIDWHLYH